MKQLLEKISKYWQVRPVVVAGGALLVIYAFVMPVHSDDAIDLPADAVVAAAMNTTEAPMLVGAGDRIAEAAVQKGFPPSWMGENHSVASELSVTAATYREGKFPRDLAEAIRRLRKVAEAGDPAAQFLLGYAYQQGFGVPKDGMEMAVWYNKAGEARTAGAGASRPVTDLSHAMETYRKAADAGDIGAELYLALTYDLGQGVPHSAITAAHWYSRAATAGSVAAGNNLAALYHNGDGMPRDDMEAARWYSHGAARGSATAQYCLGRLYLDGDGVRQDETTAAEWLEKAAQQGHAPAQVLLSEMYATGRGVQGNTAKAYMWINLASATEDQARLSRERVEEAISPGEVAEGQKLAHEWLTHHPRML